MGREVSRKSRRSFRTAFDARRDVPVTIVKKGTLFYTGGGEDVPLSIVFLTPQEALARAYAELARGTSSVHAFRLKRDLRLVEKTAARHAIRDSSPVGEYDGFGTDDVDLPVARALERKARKSGERAEGLDGWAHKLRSPTLSEVMVFNLDVLDPVGSYSVGVNDALASRSPPSPPQHAATSCH